MIRERILNTATFTAGTTSTIDLPRDAVYHILQLSLVGNFQNIMGSGGTGCVFDDCFPFSLIKQVRLVRNGSDTVYQSNGCLLAREHYYLNETFPHARLYTLASSLETLLLSSAALALGGKGLTVPANDEGIGMTQVNFATTTASSTTVNVNFDAQVDLYLQEGPQDLYYGTLVDARRLSSYQLIIDWANVTDIAAPGTANTNTVTATLRISSYDQDNLSTDIDFGTFKRSQLSISNLAYGSTNQQILLTRGNYFHGVIIDTLAFKASSTIFPVHENGVLTQLTNRVNTNFLLRVVSWEDLQRKNQADNCANNAYTGSRGMPNGCGYLYYPVAGDRAAELVPTHVMDQFDLLVNLASATTVGGAAAINQGINGPENGATTGSTNPVLNLLLEEVIPGVTLSARYPQGANAGSVGRTTAKPYANA